MTVVELNGAALSTALVTSYTYDEVGNLDTVVLPNNVRTDYDYDSLNRITSVKHEKLNDVDPEIVDHLLGDYVYTLLDNGQRDTLTETVRQTDGTYATKLLDYDYDDLGRLIQEIHDEPTAGDDFTIDYVYDLVGNRLEKNTSFENSDLEEIDYTYNELDQLLQETVEFNGSPTATTDYTYNDNGSLTSKISVGGDSYIYTYNLQNRLYTATIDRTENGQTVEIDAEYTYNENGIRVQSDTTTTIDGGAPTNETKLFLIDPANPTGYAQVLEELASVGATPDKTYLIGLDILAQAAADGTLLYLLADALGSTRLLADAAGIITERFAYDGYGKLLRFAPGALNLPATSLLYTGEQFDSSLFQYYLRARYYDTTLGRFNRLDPLEGKLAEALTLHRYIYVHANPVNGVDPSGESTLTSVVVSASIGAILLVLSAPRTLNQHDPNSDPIIIAGVMDFAGGRVIKFVGRLASPLIASGSNWLLARVTRDLARRKIGHIWYGGLDDLARPSGVRALVTRNMLGAGSKASRHIQPPGFVSGAANHSRGHLIARILGGSGKLKENLVTMFQNPANNPIMEGFELQVKVAVERGEAVELLVQPLYHGNDLIPHSVRFVARGSRGFRLTETIPNQ